MKTLTSFFVDTFAVFIALILWGLPMPMVRESALIGVLSSGGLFAMLSIAVPAVAVIVFAAIASGESTHTGNYSKEDLQAMGCGMLIMIAWLFVVRMAFLLIASNYIVWFPDFSFWPALFVALVPLFIGRASG